MFRFGPKFSGVFQRGSLRSLLKRLASNADVRSLSAAVAPRPCASCTGVGIECVDGAATFVVERLTLVDAAGAIAASDLTLEKIPRDCREIFVRPQAACRALSPERDLFQIGRSARLSCDRGDDGLPIARLNWSRDEELPMIDDSWWPNSLHIGDDARSVQALSQLRELAESTRDVPHSLRYLLATGERRSWGEVIVAAFDWLERRGTKLAAANSSDCDDAHFVSMILRAWAGIERFPPTLAQLDASLTFVEIALPTRSSIDGGIETVVFDRSAAVTEATWLAIIAASTADDERTRVALLPHGGDMRVSAGKPFLLCQWEARTRIEIAIEGKLSVAAIYRKRS